MPGPRRFVVIGCGSIGRRHIKNLITLGERDILAVDPDEARRQAVAASFGLSTAVSVAEAWEPDRDVAVIASPTSLHVEHALEAARHGCHLFVEKPLAAEWRGLDELTDAIRERDLISLVACNMRFHHGPRTLKRLIAEGAIGTVTSVIADAGQYLPDWHPGEDYRRSYSARRELGGGVVLDGIHELDYLSWIFGDVRRVYAVGGHFSHLEIDTEDTSNIMLTFASGLIAIVHLDYVQRAYARSCKVIGDQGTLVWNIDTGVRHYAAALGSWRDDETPPGRGIDQMYIDEMRHFLRCLDRLEPAEQDVAAGARVVALALEVKRSMSSGEVVTLSSAPYTDD